MDKDSFSLERLSDRSLLVSTPARLLLRFHCPIKAICIRPVGSHQPGESVFIEAIIQDRNHPILYQVGGLYLPHSYFEIQF